MSLSYQHLNLNNTWYLYIELQPLETLAVLNARILLHEKMTDIMKMGDTSLAFESCN